MEDLARVASRPIRTRWAGRPLFVRDVTASTNDDARAAARDGAPHGYAVVADAQTAGRGRAGRAWVSPAGENLYLSVVVRPAKLRAGDAPVLALAAALAVTDAVAARARGRTVSVKWPNDVRIEGRKVAGILVEGSVRGGELAYAVVGIGVNVRGAQLPDAIATTATTLRLASGADVDRGEVLVDLLAALESRVDALLREGAARTVEAVAARCDTLGTRVRVGDVEGVAEAIAPSGALVVRRDDGARVEVHAGDVLAAG